MPSKLNKVWILIEGGIVEDGRIEIQHFNKITKGLQQIVNLLQETKYPNINKEDFKLYMGTSILNSYLVDIEPPSQVDLFTGEPIFNSIGVNIRVLSESLNESEQKFTDTLENLFLDNIDRIRFLNNFLDVLSQRDYRVNVGFSPIRPDSYFALPPYHDVFIKKLIKKYTSQATVEKIGIIVQQNGEPPRFFTVKTENGDQIKCFYPSEMDSFIHELYKNPILVKGIVSKGIQKKEMKEIFDLKRFTNKTVTIIGEFKLKIPLKIEVSYDKEKELWRLSNTDIAVFGHGGNLADAEISFSDAFERLIIGFLLFNNSELSQKSKEIKDKIRKYVDIEDYSYLVEVDVE